MDKRITAIKINNFRAYFGDYEPIQLEKGDNLLIYGENGSGKSSLYKAINNYLISSNNTLKYTKNRYQNKIKGQIELTFSDFDSSTSKIISGTEVKYKYGSGSSDNNISFIQTASLTKGFLDYTDLLNVYFHKEPQPNLFELIILTLLGEHIPVSTGGSFKFRDKWIQLQQDLIDNAYTRNDRCHRSAKRELPIYETHLRHTLNEVFSELNRLLADYFNDLNIELDYILKPLKFNYGYKWNWYTTSDLRLTVKKDGRLIKGGYNDFLNEARLSAIAICLYLASLKRNPTSVELKILYLDDVFIGLDASNRIPILNILRNEFSDYQKFISTYDRHWFELAKRHFEVYNDMTWQTIEMYVGKDINKKQIITKPIIVKGLTNFEKGVQYLHHRIRPDYPAAANYFRKAIEEIIQNYIPKYELIDTENTQLPDYKLTTLLSKTKNFLNKINSDTKEISTIIGLLHNLIHPLSHHEISSPIYKNELTTLETAIIRLHKQFIDHDFQKNFKCGIEAGKRLKITFTVKTVPLHICVYEIILLEPIILEKPLLSKSRPKISQSKCYTDKCYGEKNGTSLKAFNPKKSDPNFNYSSIEEATDLIYNFLTTTEGRFPKKADYLKQIEYFDGSNWEPLNTKLVW